MTTPDGHPHHAPHGSTHAPGSLRCHAVLRAQLPHVTVTDARPTRVDGAS
ncbi:hypothetical protein AB0B27_10875 [Micromonospora rifamycinica]